MVAPTRTTVPWWGRISLLWLMAVPLIAVLYTLTLPLLPNDLWGNARAGAHIATLHRIPTTNLSASGLPMDTPYTYQAWAAGWLLYQIIDKAGVAWLVVLRSVCIGLAWALLMAAGYRRCLRIGESSLPLETTNAAARCTALAALLSFLMAASNMEARPQLFSIPLFALFVYALSAWPWLDRSGIVQMGAFLIIGMVLWVNLHGAFFTGLLVMSLYVVVEVVVGVFNRSALSPPTVGGLVLTLALLLLASLLNPQRVGIYPYVLRMSGNQAIRQYVTEWQPPTFTEWHSAVFFLSPLPLLLSLLWARRRSIRPIAGRASEWCVLILLAVMGLMSVRAIMWYAMFFCPVAAVAFFRAWSRPATEAPPAAAPQPAANTRAMYVINGALAAFLCLLAIPLLPWFKPLLPWPPAYRERFAPTPYSIFARSEPALLLDRSTPVEAVEQLRRDPPAGRLFCDMEYGSYISWALYPHTLPATDPRIEMYPSTYWERYRQWAGGPPGIDELLARSGYDAALLDAQKQPGLVARLTGSPQWQLTFSGWGEDKSRLFRRKHHSGKVVAS